MYRENPGKILSLHLEFLPLQTLRLFFIFSPFQFLLILLFLSLLILENPAKIPVWQKIRQSIPQLI